MGIALLSVQAPRPISLSQFPSTNPKTWLHVSATLKTNPSKSAILLCAASVVEGQGPASPPPDDSLAAQSESATEPTKELPLSGCKSCGREEVEKGCNGEGRIQGGKDKAWMRLPLEGEEEETSTKQRISEVQGY
ncbi:hypothetical protein L3X38_028611 [Prunus dulcis]|uniref:Uncharacterized protein n=1 Tax=Prunus dulcis TaxID=3755 RepID=A0AAD4Z1L9_PRUDU|nr:hypothetical protein L3X38_028611 [Prunus dulcis]